MQSRVAICLIIVALAVVSLSKWCNRSEPLPTKPVLRVQDKARVDVKGHNVTIVTRNDKGNEVVKKQYAPYKVTMVTDKDGNVSVKAKRFGVSIDPGIGASFYRDKLLLSTDLRVVYLHRFSIHGALLWSPTEDYVQDIIKPAIFMSYALPYDRFSNTSLFTGVTLDQRIIAGIRLGF